MAQLLEPRASGTSVCHFVPKLERGQPFLLSTADTESFIPGRRVSKCAFPLEPLETFTWALMLTA